MTNELSILPCQGDELPLPAKLTESMRRVVNHMLIHVNRAAEAPQWRQSEEKRRGERKKLSSAAENKDALQKFRQRT